MKNTTKCIIVKCLFLPIAKHFWKIADEIYNMPENTLEQLAKKEVAMHELEKEFYKLPENIRNFVGNSRKSMFI